MFSHREERPNIEALDVENVRLAPVTKIGKVPRIVGLESRIPVADELGEKAVDLNTHGHAVQKSVFGVI